MSNTERPAALEFVVREMTAADADMAAALSGELGYPMPGEEMKTRLQGFALLDNHVVYAAYAGVAVVGWIDVGVVHHLQSAPYGEIGGLVVSAAFRGRGIGRTLVARAEQWITERGLRTVLVRSQIGREAAHAFYLGQDYRRIKTSAVFTKSLVAQPLPEQPS